MLIVIHHSAANTMPSMEFSYTCCTDLYSTWAAGPVPLPHTLYTLTEVQHGNTPLRGEHSASNGTSVHPLCGAVMLHGGGPRTSPTGSVYILGSPIAPYSLGVRLLTTLMAMHHSAVNTLTPTKLLYTRCTACTAKWQQSRSVFNRLCTHPGKSRSALFTRYTTRNDPHSNGPLRGEHSATNGTSVHPLCGAVMLHGGGPRTSPTGSVYILGSPIAPYSLGVRLLTTLMAMHHSAVNTLTPTKLLYTRCTACTAKWQQSRSVFNRLCTHPGKSRSALFTRYTTRNDPHSNGPLRGEHSATNGVFVHPLYGPVQLNGGGPSTSNTGSIHILGSLVVPCTLGVRLGITLMAMHLSAVNTLLLTELLYTRCA